jgi:hypothetical protein
MKRRSHFREMIGLDLSDECAANGCRLRIGPQFSDP